MEKRVKIPNNVKACISEITETNMISVDIELGRGSELIIDNVHLPNLECLWIEGSARYDMRTRLIESSSRLSGNLSNLYAPKLWLLFTSGVVYEIDVSSLPKMTSLQHVRIWDYENPTDIPVFPESAKTIEFNGWVGSIETVGAAEIASRLARSFWLRPSLSWRSSYYDLVHDTVRSLASQMHRLA